MLEAVAISSSSGPGLLLPDPWIPAWHTWGGPGILPRFAGSTSSEREHIRPHTHSHPTDTLVRAHTEHSLESHTDTHRSAGPLNTSTEPPARLIPLPRPRPQCSLAAPAWGLLANDRRAHTRAVWGRCRRWFRQQLASSCDHGPAPAASAEPLAHAGHPQWLVFWNTHPSSPAAGIASETTQREG